MASLALHDLDNDVIGSIRTFGEYGPMYEVTGVAPTSTTGDPMVSILVIESGEILDYELEAVLADPLKP
jgi:hypothetical protein